MLQRFGDEARRGRGRGGRGRVRAGFHRVADDDLQLIAADEVEPFDLACRHRCADPRKFGEACALLLNLADPHLLLLGHVGDQCFELVAEEFFVGGLHAFLREEQRDAGDPAHDDHHRDEELETEAEARHGRAGKRLTCTDQH